ncbi:MAG: hypothetical protein IPG64_06985 [Haliea sp.]|nr:hypothetical protein [Haliea sp.]
MSKRVQTPLQEKFYEVIFGTETPAGKWFDIGLIAAILPGPDSWIPSVQPEQDNTPGDPAVHVECLIRTGAPRRCRRASTIFVVLPARNFPGLLLARKRLSRGRSSRVCFFAF